jgi:hypothetical protein
MATVAELARLRDMINEPDSEEGWMDERLETYIAQTVNANGSLNLRAAAAAIWEAKAAEAAALVDVTESASSRRNSQFFEHAQKMAAQYGVPVTDPTSPSTRMRSLRIVRPTRG